MEAAAGFLVLIALVALIVGIALVVLRWRSKDSASSRSVAIAFGVAAGSFVVGLILMPVEGGSEQSSVAVRPQSFEEAEPVAEPERFSVVLPDSQVAFMKVISASQEDYAAASNELRKSSVKMQRNKDLGPVLPKGLASDWYAQIETLGTTGKANAFVSLRLPESNIWVKTWNNEISDATDRTLVQHGSGLYDDLADMEVGQWVIFTARLMREVSLTEEGGMMEPEFLARIQSIRPAFVREDGTVYKGAG